MATNLLVFDKGDLDDIFQPKAKESVKRSDISIKVGTIDITNRYEPTNGFDQINFNTGYIFQGQDIRYFFQRKGYLPQYFLKADKSTINEGETVNFNITVIDVPDNTNICFETSSNSDFITPTGTVTIQDSKGSFSLTAKNDLTTEGTEVINVFLKRCDTGKVVTTTNLLVTVKDTSRTPPTYKLTPDKTVVNEGGVVKITVNTTDVDDNTIFYYDTSSNSDFTNPTGTVTITSGVGSFNLNVRNDLTTEGVEIITVNLRTDSTNGTIVKTSDQITINDTSRTPPTYKVTPSVLAINEGGSVTLTVTTTDVDNGVVLYYDTSSNSDFITATGLITVTNSKASFVLIAKEDLTTEGVETFTVNIRTSSLTGPIVCTSSSITINDTSRTPPTYVITANKTAVNEGESVTFTVTTADVDNGTALFYDTSSNSDFVNPTGSIIIRNNTGSFTLDVKNDVTTDGAETFVANLRIGSITGTTVRTSASITINDTSTSIPTYDISASKSSVDEGSSVELCVTTTNTNNGTTLYYDVGIFGGYINTETDINIIVDSSGSNSPTANVLSKMISSGLLRQYLLPYYNNNTAIYGQRVKFLSIGSERTFSLDMLGRAGSASCKRLINLVFQDETYGVYNNTNNVLYNQDMTALHTRLDTYTPGFFAGAVFQVVSDNQFKTFLERVKAGTGAFTSLNLKDKPEVTISYGVTDGGTQQYYLNLIIDTLKSLNFKLPGGSGSTVVGEDFILPTGVTTSGGVITVQNNKSCFTLYIKADSLTEGTESFVVNIRTGSNTGPVVRTSPSITINDTSLTPPSYKITADRSVVNEGGIVKLTLNTERIANGTALYYSTSRDDDFLNPTGIATIFNNTADFELNVKNDLTSEGTETFVVYVRIGTSSGNIVTTSSSITICDTSLTPPTYNTSPNVVTISEGGEVTFTVTTTNVANNTVLYYDTSNTHDIVTPTGSFTIVNNTATFKIAAKADSLTEGLETFTVNLRTVSNTGTIVHTSTVITILDTTASPPTYKITPRSTIVNEGTSLVFDIETTNVSNNTVLYYDLAASSIATSSDFVITNYGTSGNVTVNNNTASFTYNIAADQLTEGAETFFVNLRTISNAGKVVKTSPTVTITDTSPTPATYASTPDKYAVNEGDVVTFDVKTTNVTNGTVLYYDTSSDSDFDNPKGSVVINKNSGVVKLNVKNDFTTEDVAALCTGIVGLPASINGINVTASQTGAVSVYNTNFNGVSRSTCNGQVVMPPGVAMVGNGTKPYTYTLRFSEPVNNIGLAINGTGPTAETFTITTDTEKPVITAGTNCFSKIEDNKIISGDQSAPTQWYPVTYLAWGTFMNAFAIWVGAAQQVVTNSFTASVKIETAGTYTIESTADNYATINITGPNSFSRTITPPVFTTSRVDSIVFTSPGVYTLNVSVENAPGTPPNNPAGIGIRINNPSGGVIWNTRDWAATHGGGGGVFYIKSRTPYKSITVTGNGSVDGSVIGICSNINTESFTMRLRAGSETSPVVHTSTSVLINDTSLTAPVYNITPNKSSVNEGGNVIFTVTTINVPNNTVVYYDTDVTPDLINDTTDFNITIDTSGSMNAAVPELKGILNNTKLRNYLLRFYSNANILTKRVKIHEVNKERTFQMIDRKGANDSTRLINFAFQDESSPYSNANTLQSDVTALLAVIDDYPYQYYDGTVFQVIGFSAFKTLLQTTKAKQFVNTPNVNIVYDINKDGNSDYFADVIINRLEELRAQYIASDFVLPAGILTPTGSLTIQNSTASFTAYVKADAATEGTESFNVNLRTTNSNGPVVATSSSVTIVDSSKTPAPTYDITPNKTVVNEGEVVVFNIVTTRVPDNTIFYYTLSRNDVSSGLNNGGANSGSVTITNNKASFTVYVDDDNTTEGYQTFTASLRTGSIGGTVVSTSEAVGINDTSTTPITYSIQPNKSQIKEGETVVFNVATTGVANGTVLNYEITRYLGVVSTNVKNFTPASFGRFPAGKYVIKYVSGAWSAWDSGDRYLFDSFMLKAGGTDILIGDGSWSDLYTSARVESVAQNWSAGEPYSKVFQHPGGNISLVILDSLLTDNRHHPNGTPKYALYALSDLLDVTNEFGTVTIQGNKASINITAKSDGTPEGYQEIRANLRRGGASGRIVATSNAVGVRDNQINSAFYFGVKQTAGDCWFTRAFNTQHPNLTFRVNTNMAGTSRFDFTGTNRKDYKGLQMDSGRNDITINNIQLIVNKEAVYTWNLGLVLSTKNNINGSSTQNFAVTYNAAANPKATFTKTGNGVTWIEGNINLEIPPNYIK